MSIRYSNFPPEPPSPARAPLHTTESGLTSVPAACPPWQPGPCHRSEFELQPRAWDVGGWVAPAWVPCIALGSPRCTSAPEFATPFILQPPYRHWPRTAFLGGAADPELETRQTCHLWGWPALRGLSLRSSLPLSSHPRGPEQHRNKVAGVPFVRSKRVRDGAS